jgi:hypothetical protein
MKTKSYELRTFTAWQRIFLQSIVNGAPYEEQQFETKWPWPENTYLQRRLQYVRLYQSAEELWQAGQQAPQKDMVNGMVE